MHHSDSSVQFRSIRYPERLTEPERALGLATWRLGGLYENSTAGTVLGFFKEEVIRAGLSWRSQGSRVRQA